tara:strand:- start:7284 stop:7670 length:387 start_codon:yes stop_codon:yes gene_type:complete
MKKILAILSLIICVSITQAQSTDSDAKLLAKYSQKELKKLKKTQPQEYIFAKYCVDNAFYVALSSKEKVAKNPTEYGEVTINDISNINFFSLKIELKQNDFQAFIIKGTDKLLIVKSKGFIQRELKKK